MEDYIDYVGHQRRWLEKSGCKPNDKCIIVHSFTSYQSGFPDVWADIFAPYVGKVGTVLEGPGQDKRGIILKMDDETKMNVPFYSLVVSSDE